MIKIRKTQPTDITILMDIFEQAKHIMRKDGNMLQWRGNYPSREIVIADIEQGNSYVCTDDTEEIIGTFAFIRGNDPTYTHIYEGKWVEDTLPYGVIHRLASTEHSKGVANACLQNWNRTHKATISKQVTTKRNPFEMSSFSLFCQMPKTQGSAEY